MTGVTVVVEQLRRRVEGGIGTCARGLLAGLAALGDRELEVTLVASRSPTRPDPLGLLGYPVSTSLLPGLVLQRLWDAGLGGLPGTAPGRVVHATSLLSPPVRERVLSTAVFDLAWRSVPEHFTRRGRIWHEAALLRAVQRSAAIVVPSAATAEALGELPGLDRDAIEQIVPGSDHLPAPDEPGATALLRHVGVETPYFIVVGTLEPRKNLPRLIEAYEIAARSLPEPWPLLVVGPAGWGPDNSGSSAPCASGRPRRVGRVIPTGYVKASVLAALYRRARLVAYVPLQEGFGLPALEAMAAGTPLVSSPVPSVVEALRGHGARDSSAQRRDQRPGELSSCTGQRSVTGTQGHRSSSARAGYLVDPLDVEAIADALVVVGTNEAIRARLVREGGERAQRCSWVAAAEDHLRLWRRLDAVSPRNTGGRRRWPGSAR